MRALILVLIAVLALAACEIAGPDEPELGAASEPLKFPIDAYIGTTSNLALHLIAVPAGPRCPQGFTQYTIDYEECLDPVRYSCTAYWCTDGMGHHQLATPRPFQTNPVCTPSVLHPECSSNPSLREKFVPTRADLVERAPHIFPRELLDVPLKP
jgi:hypothetical protein